MGWRRENGRKQEKILIEPPTGWIRHGHVMVEYDSRGRYTGKVSPDDRWRNFKPSWFHPFPGPKAPAVIMRQTKPQAEMLRFFYF